jgi:hypothetical protein
MTNFNQERKTQVNPWIQRYVYALSKNLPEKLRKDVELEMTTNILDMLPENAQEQDVKQVLLSLGSPKKMALSYFNREHYVISPAIFHIYWDVLKLVATIVVILTAIGVFFDHVLPMMIQTDGIMLALLIPSFIFAAIIRIGSSLVSVFGIVTLIFAAIEYFGGFKKRDQTWSLEDLPELPAYRAGSINIIKEVITTIITAAAMTALFIALRYPESAFYTTNDGVSVFILMPGNYDTYFIFFILMVPFYLIGRYLYIKAGGWTKLNVGVHIVYQISFAVLILMFINDPLFLNPDFIASISVETDLNILIELFRNIIKVVSAIVVVATLADIYTPIRRVYEKRK